MNVERTIPTCYRHPDRETRLSCTTCERPVCVDCAHRAAVGQKCPECSAPQGRSRVITAEELRGGARASAPISLGIIVVCVAVFVAGMVSPDLQALIFGYGAQANGLVAEGESYRLFTAAFLHSPGFVAHILFNMFALYLFGPQLEREAGSAPFAALYLAAALSGGAAFYLSNPDGIAVGASGAIFGLFGAWLAAALRNRHTVAGRAGLRQLLILLGINAALPLIVEGIAWEAHLGGLVAGFAISMLWGRLGGRSQAVAWRTLAAATLGVAALAVVVVA